MSETGEVEPIETGPLLTVWDTAAQNRDLSGPNHTAHFSAEKVTLKQMFSYIKDVAFTQGRELELGLQERGQCQMTRFKHEVRVVTAAKLTPGHVPLRF